MKPDKATNEDSKKGLKVQNSDTTTISAIKSPYKRVIDKKALPFEYNTTENDDIDD